MGKNFDERYPTLFQPGGDKQPENSIGQQAPEPTDVHLETTGGEPAPAGRGQHPRAAPEGNAATAVEFPDHPAAAVHTAPTQAGTTRASSVSAGRVLAGPVPAGGSGAPRPAWRWLVPVIAAGLMLAGGLFSLMARFWVPASMEADPAKFHGLTIEPWGTIISHAAPALLGSGFGLLAALLFLASRRKAATETILRAAFAVVALCLGVTGWVALFATVLFPETLLNSTVGYAQRPQMPLSYSVMPCGSWLLAVALFMFAALFVVPRRWQRLWTGANEDQAAEGGLPEGAGSSGTLPDGDAETVVVAGNPSPWRGLLFGVVAVAAGFFALFAPYLFPLSTGVVTAATSEGGLYTRPDWASVAQYLTPPFMLAGLVVLCWACIHAAVTPRLAGGNQTAELDGNGVVP